jgi:hypothetical protein
LSPWMMRLSVLLVGVPEAATNLCGAASGGRIPPWNWVPATRPYSYGKFVLTVTHFDPGSLHTMPLVANNLFLRAIAIGQFRDHIQPYVFMGMSAQNKSTVVRGVHSLAFLYQSC